MASRELQGAQGGRTVPVTLDGLGGEGGDDAEVLSEAVQQPAGGHDLVTHLGGAHGADLELPLPRHHLSVDAADDQARLQSTPSGVRHNIPQHAESAGGRWEYCTRN